eukprot:s955_g24.t1
MAPDTALTVTSCISRVQHLEPLMRAFSTSARLRESILSKISILRGRAESLSEFRRMEHELSLARAATLGDGRRMARASLWAQAQGKICQSQEPGATGELLQAVRAYKPWKDADSHPQVLVVNDGAEGLVYVAVLTVYRGTLQSGPKGKPKKLRLTRPSIVPLVPSQCKALRAVRLSWVERHKIWFACAASPCNVYDTLGHVVGEVPVDADQVTKLNVNFQDKWISRVPPKILDHVLYLRAHPELLQEGDDVPQAMAEAEAMNGSLKVSETTFTHRDFSRGLKGTAKLEAFLEKLPTLYLEAGAPFLEAGTIALHNSTKLQWSHVVKRAASYFDYTVQSPKKPDDYGLSVLTVLRSLLPDAAALHKSREQAGWLSGKVYWTQLGTQYKARGGPSVQRNSKLQRANLDGSEIETLVEFALKSRKGRSMPGIFILLKHQQQLCATSPQGHAPLPELLALPHLLIPSSVLPIL